MVAHMRNPRRAAIALLGACMSVLGGLGLYFASAQPVDPGPTIMSLELEGVVDPFMANHLRDGIAAAQEEGSAAVLITIDTPGGLISSTRTITEAILGSDLPVICYVAPDGARAGSAGAFVLMSCPFAVMAPGTNVGAATPVGINGITLSKKVTNDAAATMRALAQRWNRNADVAETFVTQAASLTAEEALEAGVIDSIEPSETSLLANLDGRTVSAGSGATTTLSTKDARLVERSMGPAVRFFHSLLDPTLAFVFFWLGLALIVLELLIPGHVFSGTLGTLMLVTSLISFGMLPIRLVAVVALIASVVFFLLELHQPGLGIWSAAAAVTLIVGGLFLYDGAPGVRVSPVAILAMAGVMMLFFGVVVTKALAIGRMPPAQGAGKVIGLEGVVIGSGLAPDGVIRVAAEEWQATSDSGSIPVGAPVRVTALKGLRLTVEPIDGITPAAETLPQASRGGDPR